MDNRKTKRKTLKIILIIDLLVLVVGIGIYFYTKKTANTNTSSVDLNSLVGTFVYRVDGTKYEFKEDGTGSMSSGNYKFDYTYSVKDNIIILNFKQEEVHDAKYTYKLKDGFLTLVAEDGTVTKGQEYQLEKENK